MNRLLAFESDCPEYSDDLQADEADPILTKLLGYLAAVPVAPGWAIWTALPQLGLSSNLGANGVDAALLVASAFNAAVWTAVGYGVFWLRRERSRRDHGCRGR